MYVGNTVSIQGVAYTWSSANENGLTKIHTDNYIDGSGHTVKIVGSKLDSSLAAVYAPNDPTTDIGYIQNGVYSDYHQSFSGDGSWQMNGVNFTHRDVQRDSAMQKNTNGTLYVSASGHLTLLATSSGHETYGSGQAPVSGQPSITLFGKTFQFHDSSITSTYSIGASFTTVWTDKYVSGESTLGISHTNTNGVELYSVQVWDPQMGSLNSDAVGSAPWLDLASLTWQPRSAPAFAKEQLWMDGTIFTWVSGTVSSDGLITDIYNPTYDPYIARALIFEAQVNDYFFQGNDASVRIGGDTGTVGHDGTFHLSGHSPQNAEPNRSAPAFTNSNTILSVDGSSYAFIGGYQDVNNFRTDVFVNPSCGRLTIRAYAGMHGGNVMLSRNGTVYTGTFLADQFSVSNINISYGGSQPSQIAPPAFWIGGKLYLQDATNSSSYVYATGDTLDLSTNSGNTWLLEAANGAFSGQCDVDQQGVFRVYTSDDPQVLIPAIVANADGTPHIPWDRGSYYYYLPPAVNVDNHLLVFLGITYDEVALAAHYGSPTLSAQNPWLLKVRLDGDATSPYTAIHTNYSTGVSTTGSYSSQTHLFQTSSPNNGFPTPIYAVNPNANYIIWSPLTPDSATGLPASFLVNGETWRYSGTDTNGSATYVGYYSSPETGSQVMTVAAPDASGARVVTVTDPYRGDGTPKQGTLNDVRGSARLSDGSEVYSGNFAGQQVNPTLHPNNLQTIDADLDITGNVISFGALTGNTATAGATFQFQDATLSGTLTASLYSTLARPQAQWLWTRMADSSGASTLPVMKLDATHKLTLYDIPATGQPQNAGVVLDPTPGGVSTIRGILRVRPGGDIDMGEFTASPAGAAAP